MIVIIGKSASGKDTIVNTLCEKYGFKKIPTYTTRPMRKGESNGEAYNFVTEDRFINMKDNDEFIETREYNTVDGTWYYGSSKKDILSADKNSIIILTPDAIKRLSDKGIYHKVIYIYSNRDTIKKRLSRRGDKPEEVQRRMATDAVDFVGAELLSDCIIYNNGNYSVDEIARRIYKKIEDWFGVLE